MTVAVGRVAALFLLLVSLARAQTDGAQRWAFSTLSTSTAGNIVASPSVAPDGTVYIGVEIGSSTSTNPSGRLFAIDPNGAQKWVFTTPEWIDSTPAIAPDGTLYFGCWNGVLYALRADGTTKWTYSVESYISGSPAIASDGTVYFGTGTGGLHALNPDGSLAWSFFSTDWIESSPSVAPDGTIYFGSWDNTVYAVAKNGVEKWHYATGGDIVGSPAIAADGTVYVGSRDLSFYAFTPEGALKWTAALGDTIESSAVIGADGTIYVPTTGGRLFALNPDGTEKWRYPAAGQAALNGIYSSPAVRADGTILFGSSDNALYALTAQGTLLWTAPLGDWADSSPVVASDGTIYIGCSDKKLYSFYGNAQPTSTASPWPSFRRNSTRTGRSPAIATSTSPVSQTASVGGSVALSASASATEGGPTPTYQWQFNGASLSGSTEPTLTLADLQPARAGLYSVLFSSSAAEARSGSAIVGVSSSAKVAGEAYEFADDILHPNGNTYDQLLLTGTAATLTADAGQVTRMSFIDLTDDIVQVEFSGPGTLTLVLDTPSGPAFPVNYNQEVSYMKGHAGIVITGATENTHVSVFSVGRATAYNASLFKDNVVYDGFATIAFVAIHSANGQFGGVRTANANYIATRGLAGLYAPNVQFTGPVYVGDISAADTATPVLVLGASSVTQINGGDLLQQNSRPVQISGFSQLNFVDGTTSHGALLPAQTIKGALEQNGGIVTQSVAVEPSSP